MLCTALLFLTGLFAYGFQAGAETTEIPPSWRILPTPRCVDYGSPDEFLDLGRVCIVRREGGPYRTVRDETGELVGDSTIVEEELAAILREGGVWQESRSDDLSSCQDCDTLVLLGKPDHNAISRHYWEAKGLGFDRWNDPNTPEDDFTQWSDLGPEGYVLKVGRFHDGNVILLAGYDRDDAKNAFHGAGTFYALQSLRQLLVQDNGTVRVKTVEAADSPLVRYRGCMSGYDASEDQEWRNVALMPRIKSNLNVYWYGNQLVGYNAEAAARFRYPWRPDQLDCFQRVGKYCRERFVTMVFCMNPDHFGVEWAAPKTFDGSTKDPLHYDPNHPVEPEFKKMWADLGFEVENDIDILAAKYAQLHQAVPGAMLQLMNEDDGFGLVHEADKGLFNTATGDPETDAVNYGKARATLLAAVYRRIKEICPDSPDVLPLCPPGQLPYQHVLDRNEAQSQEFLTAFGETLRDLGLAEAFPVLTTGGGTAAEVITGQTIDNFQEWAAGLPVQLHDNNFSHGFHVGAYETDPEGPHSPLQVNAELPAGYRDKELYKRLWGIVWNGLNDQHVLAWCQSQFMWNMLDLNREEVNALAVRKVCPEEDVYPLVKAFYEEFDSPACYLPDCQPPFRRLVIGDRAVFPCEAWTYEIAYTDQMRKECQRLRKKLTDLFPGLEAQWTNTFEKTSSFDAYYHLPLAFCTVYLAYGYISGWENGSETDRIDGLELRDLYLEADDIQERYFAGPESVPGRCKTLHSFYTDKLRYLYTDGSFTPSPKTSAEASRYVDVWEKGLAGAFFERICAVAPGELPDSDVALTGGWGESEKEEGGSFRAVSEKAELALDIQVKGQILIRARLGTDTAVLTDGVPLSLALGDTELQTAVCKPRWLNWHVPDGVQEKKLVIRTEEPVRVYAIEVHRPKEK